MYETVANTGSIKVRMNIFYKALVTHYVANLDVRAPKRK